MGLSEDKYILMSFACILTGAFLSVIGLVLAAIFHAPGTIAPWPSIVIWCVGAPMMLFGIARLLLALWWEALS